MAQVSDGDRLAPRCTHLDFSLLRTPVHLLLEQSLDASNWAGLWVTFFHSPGHVSPLADGIGEGPWMGRGSALVECGRRNVDPATYKDNERPLL